MSALILASLLASSALAAAPAPAAAPAAAKPPTAEVAKSTVPPPSPSTIYTAERLRDPFQPLAAGGLGGTGVSASGKAFASEDFNIHNLSLRGIMKDAQADYALFVDTVYGVTFMLRRGKLYDPKNKPVKNVTGRLRVKDKWASLETADHDVQIFRLGEEEKE